MKDLIRRLLALAIACFAAIFSLRSYFYEAWRTCEQVVVDGTVRELCNGYTVVELAPIWIVVGLLLLPDLSELEVASFVKLRKEVARQEERQDRLEDRLVSMQQLMATQTQSIDQSHNHYYQSVDAADQNLDRKAAAEGVDIGGPDAANGSESGSLGASSADGPEKSEQSNSAGEAGDSRPPTRAQLEVTLLQAWESLSETARRHGLQIQGPRGSHRDLDDDVLRWIELFQPEVDVVRRVRNSVAHQQRGLKRADLTNAIRMAEKLERILRGATGLRSYRGAATVVEGERRHEIQCTLWISPASKDRLGRWEGEFSGGAGLIEAIDHAEPLTLILPSGASGQILLTRVSFGGAGVTGDFVGTGEPPDTTDDS